MRNEPLAELLADESQAGVVVVKWPKDIRVPGAGSGAIGPFVVFEGAKSGSTTNRMKPEQITTFAERRSEYLAVRDEWLAVGRLDGRPFMSLAKVFGDGKMGYSQAERRARSRGSATFYDAGREVEVPVGTPFEKYVEDQGIDEEV